MRELIKTYTDAQITAMFDDAFGVDANLDPDYPITVAFTADTIEDFILAAQKYRESGIPMLNEVEGVQTLCIPKCQVKSGDQRKDVCVFDFGVCRAAVVG